MRQKVTIIGRGYNNRLALLRPIGELGYEISVIVLEKNVKRPIDCYSKYVSNWYICPEEEEECLVGVLMTNCIDLKQKVILIPSDDFSVSVLDQNYNKLKKYFLFPNIHDEQGRVVEWMDKEKQKILARKKGLNVANSKSVKIINGTYDYPENVSYPCFIKAQTFVRDAKHILHQCNNDEELKNVLDSICEKYKNVVVLVEEFKEIEREYAVVGFSNNDEVIIPGVIEIQSMAQGNVKGVARSGRVVPISGYETLIDKFKAYMSEIGLVGIFDIDFYFSKGNFYFGELNLRFGGSGYVVCKKGINLPLMLIKALQGEMLDNTQKNIISSSTYVNEKTCLQNWYSGYMNIGEFLRTIKRSEYILVEDMQDPVPGIVFNWNFTKMIMKKMIKKVVGKLAI